MHTKNKISYTYEEVEKDSEGYLKRTKDWNILLAKEIAQKENINLNSDHWKVIIFIRKFYLQFNITPSMRMLIKSIKEKIGKSKSNSIYLFKLFPKGPAEQASKIAGIPKPVKCL
ncbi:TusE/DsrC/DsvC family sulfur relay protein [Buchnera aphidicola]|uniref:Sulfur transfer protein DsrC/TusE n=3 Tax=cellular organisms TaxID=131567 RepID=A0A8T1XDF7_ARASU|nr:TusE/DsrC/DsvC family sulfur relay protein [Buchnera aphidicola]KAG7530713.1 sulfur transfer protein DsrC/TusE [Arabidopsis thaliana x Arabidopsis arenosa]KAG7531919.1 sulfur transfer protein DsrC/TusE [Arabidopsis suecica]AHG59930.1 Ycck [Buchnera aphidicola str. USDA (Myzus persicae)]AHG60510.1 Ycck [Buchnera aphidicola str. W106 (Myzus persicae)]AHG61083.1 Ycck [Buchnera aphidicola str. G002 (Myzus persicae)]